MDWSITQNGDNWQVMQGDVPVGPPSSSPAEALAALETAIAASEAPAVTMPADSPGRFRIPILVPSHGQTDDDRIFTNGTWRTPPLALMFQNVYDVGHFGARWCGTIDAVSCADDGTISAEGFYAPGETGLEAQSAVDAGLRGVSMDATADEIELTVLDMDEEGNPTRVQQSYDGYCIAGATITPIPAFREAYIENDMGVAASADAEVAPEVAAELVEEAAALLACADTTHPAAAWFTDPELTGPTPLTVQADGRVFGHAALWGTCHIGNPGDCLTPPPSTAGYAHFHTGEVETADGSTVATGALTLGTGHASLTANARRAAEHYDNTGTAVADVVAGEDDFGIWVAGALRPGVTDEQIHCLRASAPSGDWRRIGNSLELVALLAVNVPGFPVPRSLAAAANSVVILSPEPTPCLELASGPRARQSHGTVTALVAAGVQRVTAVLDPTSSRLAELEARLTVVEQTVQPLRPTAARELERDVLGEQ